MFKIAWPKAKVRVIDGKCSGGFHKVGGTYEIGATTPKGMCLAAFGVVAPFLGILHCNGEFPWSNNGTKIRVHCPDPEGIIIEIKKI
jgi:uncharacterized repeat protein (TIGR04076 family)